MMLLEENINAFEITIFIDNVTYTIGTSIKSSKIEMDIRKLA